MNIAAINDLVSEDLKIFEDQNAINLNLGALKYADALISGN